MEVGVSAGGSGGGWGVFVFGDLEVLKAKSNLPVLG